jgi:hypothetical protein
MRAVPVFLRLGILLSLLAAVLLYPPGAVAAWPNDGAPAGTGTGDQSPVTAGGTSVCHDGVGGVIVAYQSPTNEIRINRLDGLNGDRQWNGTSGALVTSTAGGPPHVVSDGLGGAWIAWYDTRTTGSGSGLYLQHYDIDGTPVYFSAGGGARIAGGAWTDPYGHRISLDATPAGNVQLGFGTAVGVWVQRILLNGTLDVYAKVSNDTNLSRIQVLAVGEAAVVVWACTRNTDQGIWANRTNSAGTLLWGTSGKQVMNRGSGTPPVQHTIAWDSNELFVAWSLQRGGLRDVYAQKLDSSGNDQWGTAALGQSVLVAPFVSGWTASPQVDVEPQIVADGAGGCLIAWRDERDYHRLAPNGFAHGVDLYGQRLNGSGAAQWTANGAALDSLPGTQKDAKLVSDGAGGAILTYMSYYGITRDIWAKRLNASGSVAWTAYPCAADGEQEAPMVASDGAGGLIVAWEDDRDGDVDTYAAHLAGNGSKFVPTLNLTYPDGGERLLAGSRKTIQWSSNLSGNVSLTYQRDGFAPATIVTSTANDGQHFWIVPNLQSPAAKMFLTEPSGTVADSSDTFVLCNRPFVSGTTRSGLSQARDVAVADFDEDGVQDLAVAIGTGLAIALGNGDGTFDTPATYAMASYGRGVVTGDFDEDGIVDVAVTHETGVGLFFGLGMGGIGGGSFASVVDVPVGSSLQGIARGDFDEDGITDLAVANAGANTVEILLGNGVGGVGDGTFATPVSYATSAGPYRIAVNDFDNDGIFDLAVTCDAGDTFGVLMGQGADGVGDGTFISLAGGWGLDLPRGIAAGDFDEDGIVDLAFGNNNTTISVCLGNGDGTFGEPDTVSGEGGNRDFVVGDFTGDGHTDLVAAAGSYNQMTLYEGDGNGSFVFLLTNGTGAVPEAIVAADFDGDDRADLMTANRATNNVLSLHGNLGDCQVASTGVDLVSPKAASNWAIGSAQSIQWSAGDGVAAVNVEVSRDGGANWELLAENLVGSSWTWNVTGPVSSATRVRVGDANVANRSDESPSDFAIVEPTAVDPQPTLPRDYALRGPAPNPFNPTTMFQFDLPAATRISLRVYDVAGRAVRTLQAGAQMPAGTHRVTWDGKDDRGTPVASGVYVVRMDAGTFTQTRRAVMLK